MKPTKNNLGWSLILKSFVKNVMKIIRIKSRFELVTNPIVVKFCDYNGSGSKGLQWDIYKLILITD
jgi:hypothetical protein